VFVSRLKNKSQQLNSIVKIRKEEGEEERVIIFFEGRDVNSCFYIEKIRRELDE